MYHESDGIRAFSCIIFYILGTKVTFLIVILRAATSLRVLVVIVCFNDASSACARQHGSCRLPDPSVPHSEPRG